MGVDIGGAVPRRVLRLSVSWEGGEREVDVSLPFLPRETIERAIDRAVHGFTMRVECAEIAGQKPRPRGRRRRGPRER